MISYIDYFNILIFEYINMNLNIYIYIYSYYNYIKYIFILNMYDENDCVITI